MTKRVWINKHRKEAQVRTLRSFKQGMSAYESVQKTKNVIITGNIIQARLQ